MVENSILEDIGKKSQEIMRSNEELADRLRKNQEVISRFAEEFESLRQEMGGSGSDPAVRAELKRLKGELEDKRRLISEMIDDIKPVELDLSRREDVVNSMKQKIDDQSARIESLSKDILDSRRQLQDLDRLNTELRKQVAEKDGMVRVLKDKLAEKTSLLKGMDSRNSDLEQQIDAYRKQVFALNNKVGAVEKRVFSTDEQNQKLLYEMMRMKERLKSNDAALAEKGRVIGSREAEYADALEQLRKEEEEKRLIIMKNHAKKVSLFNAALASMKVKLDKQQKVIEEKARKENALMSEFGERMKELMMTRFEPSETVSISPDDLRSFDEPESSGYAGRMGVSDDDAPSGETGMDSGTDDGGSSLPSKIDEILPMIELAMDHGDDIDKIRHSLLSSGYSKADVENAFSSLNIVGK
ncbi:hypothetical protein JW898_03785 [Candidatus Woesearchaeota archaeon]|nr:hypothetical protein [Candidatus Woesearchaeota archaeon]